MNKQVEYHRLTQRLAALALILVALNQSAGTASSPGVAPKHASSAIAITPDGATLLVVNPDSNSLTLVATSTGSVTAELPVGIDPQAVAVSPDGLRGYVPNQDSDSVSVVDIASRSVIASLPVGDRPTGIAVSPDGRFVAVTELGVDQVRLLDANDLVTLSLIPAPDRPYGLAFTPDGRRLLVTHLLSGKVTLLPVQPFTAFLPINVRGWQSQGYPAGDCFAKDARNDGCEEALGECVAQMENNCKDTRNDYIPTWPNVAPAPAVIVNSTGRRAYLPQTMANGQGYNIAFDTTVFPKISVLNLETKAHQTSEHVSLPETDRPVGLPWDVALRNDDQELWVVNSASNDVSVINISNPTHPTRTAHIPVGDNPRGIVISPDGSAAYVNNTLAGTVSVIDTSTYTVTQVITATVIPLPPPLLNGKRLFFSSARSDLAQARWISCNTCHIEGEADGRIWKIQYLGSLPPGEQPVITRNTTSLLGMIETYPLRWSAEWDESADSEFSVRFEQFGSGLIPGDMNPTLGPPNQGRSYDLDCLALFIDSLGVPARSKTLDEAEQRGKVVFESPLTGCATCHPAPLYTDLLSHDVGTADGPGEWFGSQIDTPTLRFLFDSPPYLHDGSAPTLYDVLTTRNPGDEHGVTSLLSASEIEDLIAFLLAVPYDLRP